jgi:hypothetical protein
VSSEAGRSRGARSLSPGGRGSGSRLPTIGGFGSGQGWVLGRSLAYAGCAGLLLLVWVAMRRGDGSADRAARILLFVSTPLWVPSSWPHYFCYLPASQLLLLDDLATPMRRSFGATVVAGVLVSLSIALSSVFALQASNGWYRYSSHGAILVADLALALACCVSLWRASEATDTPVAIQRRRST